MRQFLLVALLSSIAPIAFAQAHDLPSPEGITVKANHPVQPANPTAPKTTPKTALQIEAERVAAYRLAMGVDQTASATAPSATQAPLAPNGLQPMTMYTAPAPITSAKTVHTVVKKDTLYNISKRYGVTVPNLKWANQLRGSNIQLGQQLIVPVQQDASNMAMTPNLRTVVQPVIKAPDVDTRLAADDGENRLTSYAVASGDILAAITHRTCVTEAQLIKQNNLIATDELFTGQMLALPDNHCLTQ